MIRPSSTIATLIIGAVSVLAACAASDDSTGYAAGGGGTPATGGSAGSGTGGTSATGGTGGTGASSGNGGSGGTSSDGSAGDAGSDGAAGSAGTDSGTDAADASDGGPTTSVTGSIVALLSTTTPIVDLKICVYQTPSIPCVKTDSTGHYTLFGLPVGQEILLEYTKSTYFPVLVTVRTALSALDVGQFLAPTIQEANAFATLVGTTIDPQKGQVLFTAFTPSTSGGYTGQDNVVASLTPKSGIGPYYMSATNLPDTSLTATTTSGVGLFANVNPGDVNVTLTHFSKTCKRFSTAWVGTGTTGSKVKVVAGYLTGGAAIECP